VAEKKSQKSQKSQKTQKLDLFETLHAIDTRNFDYYNNLTEDEKKGYSPLVLMRYMSSLNSQNPNAAYAVMATNEIVNLGFWNLTKHPELQHKLLCLAGLGSKQYRSWLAAKNTKQSNKIDQWLLDRFPQLNDDELSILKSSYDIESWTSLVKGSGASDAEVKDLIDTWKKQQSA